MRAALFLFLASLFHYADCSAQIHVNDVPIDTVGMGAIQIVASRF